ncbi:hypothetical protein Ndes2526B_g09607 [Nannochloris sp. 'desiccata']|nr:hypothetical protein NADE_007445 [Chlorella desiccata (nom. nud.)]KAH7615762.1 hypothetical protein NADE_007552 [Chlorella desiccata (nom. nud.)]
MTPNNASPNKNMTQGAMPASARPLHNAANNIRPAPSLQGVWRKDFQNSDMEALTKAVEAMKLGRIQKMAAISMINGLNVNLNDSRDPSSATIQYLLKVPTPFYKIIEQYHQGLETQMQRRDMRAGKQKAVAHSLNAQEMHVELSWSGQLAGHVNETYKMNSKGQLIVKGVMEVDGEKFVVEQVYNKEDNTPLKSSEC